MVTQVAKTIDDLYAEVRQILNDSQITYRYSDADMFRIINTALREVVRYRPDAIIGNFTAGVLGSNAVNTYSAADLAQVPATPFPYDDKMFYNPVVFFVAGRLELEDDEFADNNRAMILMTSFRNMLITPGG